MAASPRPNFGLIGLPVPDASGVKIAELVRLQKFAQRITSSLDLDEVVQRVADEVADSLGCVEINIYLHDAAQGELVLSGMRGCSVHGKGHRMKIGTEGMVGHVAATRKMHYAPNVVNDPYYQSCEPDVSSEVAIPLHVDTELIECSRHRTARSTLLASASATPSRTVLACGCGRAKRSPIS
jgi:putative methionine-R-sulfoxide reductase with GAF domain